MATNDELRLTVMAQAQGAMTLNLAFIGVTNGLFTALAKTGPADLEALAAAAGMDPGYVRRWAEAAFAFGMLEEDGGRFSLSALGDAFRPDVPGTLMPFAVQAALSAHVAERAAGLMRTGERPGEQVLAERPTIIPWYGAMIEATNRGLFEREVLPAVPAYGEAGERGGLVLDMGCGNGWFLRSLAVAFPGLRGIGIDGFAESIAAAQAKANEAGVSDRLSFAVGDVYAFKTPEPLDLVTMNRALHHVWDRRDEVFAAIRAALKPGGSAVIWEPRWPDDLKTLRVPRRRGLAAQNLSEHVQGNHFLRPAEIEAAFVAVGMTATTREFAEGAEAVVTGVRPA